MWDQTSDLVIHECMTSRQLATGLFYLYEPRYHLNKALMQNVKLPE